MSYPNEVYSVFAFIGFLLVSIPFPWHLEAWNTGTCLYMAWTGLACLNQFINSVIWNGNAINWAPVWCDISTRFMVGVAVGIPASSLCINRRLYQIASVRKVVISKAEKRRDIMVDLAIGLGLPILEMVLQYIAQGHRFNIFEDVGCYPFTYNTPVGYALVSVPPILIGLVSAVYCIMSIRAFNNSRANFKELLSANNNLNANRYFRLMCLAGIEVLCTVPLGSYAIYLNSTAGVISPWKSWADTHWGFSRVDQIPAIIWRSRPLTESSIELSRWLVIVCAFIFFAFFGFADEAMKNYRAAFQSVAKRVGYSTASMSSGVTTSQDGKSKHITNMSMNGGITVTLPITRQKSTRRRDSFDSFSDMAVSFQDVGGALTDEKKPTPPDLSIGPLSLRYDGSVLPDFNSDPYSPTPSSGSSSSSFSDPPSPSECRAPSFPEPALMRIDSSIEISSVRGLPIQDSIVSPSIPAPVFNLSAIPRHPADTSRANSLDMV